MKRSVPVLVRKIQPEAFVGSCTWLMAANPEAFDPKKYCKQGMAEVQKYVEQKIEVCGSANKA